MFVGTIEVNLHPYSSLYALYECEKEGRERERGGRLVGTFEESLHLYLSLNALCK